MPGGAAVKTRRAVAVLLSRFPLVTETFILREIEEMERQGQPVRLVPLLREVSPVVHREAAPWMARALYTPYLSTAIIAANFRALRRDPLRYLDLLGRVLLATARSANFLFRSLALFPKSVYLAELLQSEGVGHVHAHFATHPALAALVVSSLTGISYSFTVHAHDIFVRRALLREKIQQARFVRAISCFNRDFLRARYPDVPEEKIPVIHVGIDAAAYTSDGDRDGRGPAQILCVAAFKPYKGLPVLIEACRRLKERGRAFRCDLVGDGPLRPRLERMIARSGLQGLVTLLGPRPQDEVAGLMAKASFVVLPSVVAPDGQMEGIPVSLMEAMASRRAVVASALSGIPELVEDGVSGLLVPPGGAEELASAMDSLLAEPERANRMGERGRERVEREFSLRACVGALLERLDRETEPLPSSLRRHLEACDWGGLAVEGVGVRRRHERRESTVVELLVTDGARVRDLIFKVQKCPPAAESARREFDALSLLHGRFAGCDGFGVPRPIFLDEAGASLAMEPCRGTPLDRVIREARTRGDRRASLGSAVRRTGQWLRLFQEHTGREGDPRPALKALTERAMKDLSTCSGRGIPERLTGAVAARIEELWGRSPLPARLVGHQGDFWPGNVYVDAETVEVIDFEAYREGLPYEDAAYFLMQLELYYAYPVFRERFARLRDAFLDGYREGEALEPETWELCRVAKALQILVQSLEEGSHCLRGWWRRRTLRAAVLRG